MSSLVQSMAVPVTEDTPPDLLAGSMDLTVLLPDGRATTTSVQRATAMMDLLVQLCTAHRLPPGDHSLQPLGERGALPYKPSTPIGLLDAWSVRLLPKGGAGAGTVPTIQEHPHQLPFQHTFRLQVHLPRNQLLVSRVTPQMGLAAVLTMACREKNLDPGKYELRHPINLEERLRPELTLGDYGVTEVCVVARDAGGADALALQREQERRRRRARQQHGHAAPPPPPVARQPAAPGSAVTGSVSSGSLGGRSSSPDSTPAGPPPPRAPARKRRPAPPPPAPAAARAHDRREPAVVITEAGPKQMLSHHDGTTPTVTHSRTSSDSSGYHEASVLSDGPDTHPGDKTISSREMPPPTSNSTLPRRSKLPPATGTTSSALTKRTGPAVANVMPLSRSVSNLASASAAPSRVVHGEYSASTSSLSSTGRGPRKKKAAPPPPPVAAAPAGARAAPPVGSSAAPTPALTQSRTSAATAENRTLPQPAASAGNSDAPRAASIEEEKEPTIPERRPSHEVTAKHHQQQRSSAELPAEKADLYATLQRRLPSRGDSVTSTSSSGSDDAAGRGLASVPAPAVRPSRSRDRASAAVGDLADGESRPGPDVVAVRAPPPGSVSSKHSSIAPDEDDLAVDEGIGNDDAAEEVARAFASAAAELEAAILAEDLAAAADGNPAADYCNIDPPCPTKPRAADTPPQLPDAPAVASDGEEWHYEIPAPPSAFRDSADSPPPTPWSYAGGEVRSKANPLYESGEFVADLSATKEGSASAGEPTAATGERNRDGTTGGGETAETEASEQQRAAAGADRQLRGLLDAKARLQLPQPQLIQGPPADADATAGVALKDADNDRGEGGQPDTADAVEDSSLSPEEHRHSHSLLNHHHAGLLHDHHHHHHHHHNHHGGHPASAGMPAYLTETIDTLEGFEDLIAVGSGSRPPEEHRNIQDGSTAGAEAQAAEEVRRNSSDCERPVVVAEVVKTSEIGTTLETTSVNAEVAKEKRRNSNSTVETPPESEESPARSGNAAVESGAVLPRRRSSGEVAGDEGKEEAAPDRQQRERAQRRRTVEVGAPLANFTITTYRREIDPDKIFGEAEDTVASRVPAVTAPSAVAAIGSERRASLVSRSNSVGGPGSSAGSSRRGSQAEQPPGRTHSQGVKRSVSNVYTVLQGVAAREEARLAGAGESNNKEDSGSSQLQSLQVLRSILPQLKSAPEQPRPSFSGSTERSGVASDTSAAVPESERLSRDPRKATEEATEVDAKPHPQPYRPPAVSFASWGERPRGRAVSLKVDSDYRVGGAHTKAQQISQEPQPTDPAAAVDASKAATVNGATAEKQAVPATAAQSVPVGGGEPAPTLPQPAAAKVEPTVIRISTSEPRIRAVQLKPQSTASGEQRWDPPTARRDSAALTMRIVSHTTAAPFARQGTTSVTVNGDERVVPVVRAVELKKSALQQKWQAGEAEAQADAQADAGEERFAGVSSLAKRFSFLGDNTVVQRRNPGSSRVSRRPVSELVAASDAASVSVCAEPVHRAGSFASLVTASRASQLGRSDSSDDSGIPQSPGVSSQNGHTSPTAKRVPVTVSAAPKGFPLPVVKGFRVPGGSVPEPRRGITLVARPRAGAAAATQPPALNPHEQLMAAIRGFGGTGSLRNQAQKVAECES